MGAAKRKPVVSARAANRKGRSASLHMVRRVRSKKTHKQTGIEATVERWLKDAGADFRSEHPISRVHVDFYLPATKTVIEVCGCYWHGCAKCAKERTATQMKARRKDGRRYTFLKNAGYNLVLVWEHEIEGSPDLARKKVLEYASLAV